MDSGAKVVQFLKTDIDEIESASGSAKTVFVFGERKENVKYATFPVFLVVIFLASMSIQLFVFFCRIFDAVSNPSALCAVT